MQSMTELNCENGKAIPGAKQIPMELDGKTIITTVAKLLRIFSSIDRKQIKWQINSENLLSDNPVARQFYHIDT